MSEVSSISPIILKQRDREMAAGAEMFCGFPDRWFKGLGRTKFRCLNGHVSTMVLGTEGQGDRCLACYTRICITFPEDEDS